MTGDLELARFRIRIRPYGDMYLPSDLKGSSLRGGFGSAFRRVTCPLGPQRCTQEPCQQPHSCLYGLVFETRTPPSAPVFEKSSHIPHPFVLKVPQLRLRHFGSNDHLDFEVILMGAVIDCFPYFLFAFEELGRQGLGHPSARMPFRVETVSWVSPGAEDVIFTCQDSRIRYGGQRVRASELMSTPASRQSGNLEIQLLTPTRIKQGGDWVKNLNFEALFVNLARRIRMLFTFYGTGLLERDFKSLLEMSRQVSVAEDRLKYFYLSKPSARGQGKMPLGGLKGRITFSAPSEVLQPFIPLLKLGEWLHIGSGTAFGQGQYQMISRRLRP